SQVGLSVVRSVGLGTEVLADAAKGQGLTGTRVRREPIEIVVILLKLNTRQIDVALRSVGLDVSKRCIDVEAQLGTQFVIVARINHLSVHVRSQDGVLIDRLAIAANTVRVGVSERKRLRAGLVERETECR